MKFKVNIGCCICLAVTIAVFITGEVLGWYYLGLWGETISKDKYIDKDKIDRYANTHLCNNPYPNVTYKAVKYDCEAEFKDENIDCNNNCGDDYITDFSYLVCYRIKIKVHDHEDYITYIWLQDCYPDVKNEEFASRLPVKHSSDYETFSILLLFNTWVGSVATGLMSMLTRAGVAVYADELIGIANDLNQPVGKITLLQLAYEVSTCCTSILVNGDKLSLFRTMDWDMKSLIPITFEVEFVKNDITIFVGTTWPGYIGILTGMKPEFGVSINYRRLNDGFSTNLYHTLCYSWPISYLVRHVLTYTSSYKEAVSQFQSYPLIAPTYINVIGCEKNMGCIITRNRTSCDDLVNLMTNPYLVQTNMDRANIDNESGKYDWQDIECSRLRTKFVNEFMINNSPTKDNLWSLVSTRPIQSFDTLYMTGMTPRDNYYETRPRVDQSTFGDTSYLSKDTILLL